MRMRSRALYVSTVSPLTTAFVLQSPLLMTACMNSSVTRTLWFAFWKKIDAYASPSTPPAYPLSSSTHAFFSSFALLLMNSTISGWPAFKMTIFAARRVLPPDLMTPANASKPFMNDTGPDAMPPPESCSFEERIGERLLPVPDPHLKSMPSVFARSRIEPMVSSTELMKHAEHCGFASTPQLNQTGELKAII